METSRVQLVGIFERTCNRPRLEFYGHWRRTRAPLAIKTRPRHDGMIDKSSSAL
jgi:hypothetical protein